MVEAQQRPCLVSRIVIILLCLACSFSIQAASKELPDATGNYQALIVVLDEFLDFRDPGNQKPDQIIRDRAGQPIDPVSNYSKRAMDAQRQQLSTFQDRVRNMNVSGWSREQRVDYLAVRSRLNQAEFMLHISRPWARDPGFYVDRMLRITFTDLPVEGEDRETFLAKLRAIPVLVTEAQKHLDDVAADFADLAIHNLGHSDGVGHGYPYRAVPPAGVLGWYDDLIKRAEAQPELAADIQAARNAVQAFETWLKSERKNWTAPAGVGEVAFDWYLKHVKLMPWTSSELVILGQRELDRLWADYALERHRNQALPALEPAVSAEDYQQRINATDRRTRQFLKEQAIITIPDDIGVLDTNAPWIVRPDGRNFWEEIQFRDPSPDHLHAVIPGHRFDGIMASRDDHPIRSKIYSAGRVEGWATYLEEAMMQAGLFSDLPRVRELIQIFGIFRAARVPADVWLQTGKMNVKDVVEYWLARVPYLDHNVARVDAEIYLRRPPGYGIGYTIGALQMQRLLADRKRQLGDEFDLQAFHDRLMTIGRLPLSLIRWEMTGLDDEVRHFWQQDPIPGKAGPLP